MYNKNGPPPPYYATSPNIQSGYYQNGMPNQPIIVTTVVPLGPGPTHTICPHCHAEIETATKTEPGMIAYISGAIIALLGCIFGCCLIPCCINECMDVHHTCPNCKAYLGRHSR